MRGGVGHRLDPVVSLGDDRAVPHQDRADRHLAHGRGLSGLGQGQLHVVLIVDGVGGHRARLIRRRQGLTIRAARASIPASQSKGTHTGPPQGTGSKK